MNGVTHNRMQSPWDIKNPPELMRKAGSHGGTVNVSTPGRIASVVGGGALAAYGLTRGTLAGVGLSILGGTLVYRGVTGHCALLARLGINTAAHADGPVASVPAGRGVKVDEMIVIRRPPQQLFRFWRNLENLPRFLRHLDSVKALDETRSHWVAKAPLGLRVRPALTVSVAELDRGIEGSFVVPFVVDSTGRVDAKTLSFPSDAQPMFLRAVKDESWHWEYRPAVAATLTHGEFMMPGIHDS